MEPIFLEPRSTFREAIVGIVYKDCQPSICYSVELIYKALETHDDMSFDDAREWFDYNMVCLEDMEGGVTWLYLNRTDL